MLFRMVSFYRMSFLRKEEKKLELVVRFERRCGFFVTIDYEQDALDFDGPGDLFNEPELATVPN